jgi:putative transposase
VSGLEQYLRIKLHEARKYYPDWEYIAIGVDRAQVHLHMAIPPKYAVSKIVEPLKKNTSRRLREKFSFLHKVYWDGNGVWVRAYFVSTVGLDETTIQRYVEFLGREDTGQAMPKL